MSSDQEQFGYKGETKATDEQLAHRETLYRLFRYDLDHAVGEVDRDYPLEWGGTGRWTMVLPLM